MKISFLGWIYALIGIITLFLYYSVNISPSDYWISAFLPLGIPWFILLNLAFLLYWLFKRKMILAFISLFILVIGYKFIARTISLHGTQKEGNVKILNYNVRVFNSYNHLKEDGKEPSKVIRWAMENDSDIKCFQEFYHYPQLEMFNVIPKIKKSTPYYCFKPVSIVRNQHFGLAIFSKYPMIKKGEVKFPRETMNQAIFADIKIKKDTVRVYNAHLQSMSIDVKSLPSNTSKEAYPKLLDLLKRMKRGAIYRSEQLEVLMQHMEKCPYKTIVAGDLNDTPYSFTYEQLQDRFVNSFEEKGSGFGFTYNGKLFFLRIDNVFSDRGIKINTFKTRRDVLFSDHFPLEVTYTF